MRWVARALAAGAGMLATACATRMMMPPMPQVPAMPGEAEMRAMLDRSRGKPALPAQPTDPRAIQVVFQTGHAAAITAVALSADGRHIVSSSWDETAKVWDVASGQAVRTLTGVDSITRSATFVADTGRVALASPIGATLFDTETGRPVPAFDDLASQAVVSQHGRYGARTAGWQPPQDGRRQKAAQPGIGVIDLATDRVIATLPADAMSGPIAISDDGATLLVRRTVIDERRSVQLAREGKQYMPETVIEIWDVAARKIRRPLQASLVGLTSFALGPDGRTFVIENLDQTLDLYDLHTGALKQKIVPPGAGRFGASNSLLFSPDGGLLAHASQEGRIRLWEIPSGRLVREIEGTAVNFSADGLQLVAGKARGGAPFLHDLKSGTQRELAGGASSISDLALVGEGGTVVAATEAAGARHWNLATGELLRTFACPGGASVHTVSVSSSERWLATGCQDGAAYLWNLDTGAPLRTFVEAVPNELGMSSIVRFDRAGRRLAIARSDELFVWDVAQNRELRRIRLPASQLAQFMDPDAMEATYEQLPEDQREAMRQSISDPAMRRAMQSIRSVAFHPDGTRLAIAKAGDLALWDLGSGAKIRDYSVAAARALEAPVAASPDQELLAKLMQGGRLSRKEMKELSTMSQSGALAAAQMQAQVRSSEDTQDEMEASGLFPQDTQFVAFSADGATLHTLGAQGERMWEVETGRRIRLARPAAIDPLDPQSFLRRIEDQEIGAGGGLALSPDERYSARGFGRVIRITDLATGERVGELIGHTSDVTSVTFSSDGRFLVSGARDGAVRVWSAAQRKELAQLIAFGTTDFVAVTPDQYYRISRRGVGGVAFRVGDTLYPFEQFDLRFNRPDVVLERLGRTPAATVEGYRTAYQRRLRKLGFSEEMLGQEFHLPEVKLAGAAVPVTTPAASLTLDIQALDTRYALDRINVFVNDVPVFGTAGLAIADRDAREHRRQVEVPLVAGRNKVQVSVLNQQGAESLRQTSYTTSTAQFPPPDVYVLAIGVSRYQRESYNLRFAAKDANDLSGAYRALAGRPGAAGDVHVLELTDAKATRDSIRQARDWLKRARVTDLVVLFAAGHGMTDERSNYFFGTYDIDPERPALAGLPYEEFEALLDGIPAMQKLMLIDTCFSGEIEKEAAVTVAQQVDTGGAGVVQMRSFQGSRGVAVVADAGGVDAATADAMRHQQELFADLRRGTGAVVISSASGNEYALEGEQWANGVFTYALLDGLRNGTADANRDGVVNVSELQAHVLDQVRRLTAGGQNPTVRRENLEHDFRVY